jgi:hypothetical protein
MISIERDSIYNEEKEDDEELVLMAIPDKLRHKINKLRSKRRKSFKSRLTKKDDSALNDSLSEGEVPNGKLSPKLKTKSTTKIKPNQLIVLKKNKFELFKKYLIQNSSSYMFLFDNWLFSSYFSKFFYRQNPDLKYKPNGKSSSYTGVMSKFKNFFIKDSDKKSLGYLSATTTATNSEDSCCSSSLNNSTIGEWTEEFDELLNDNTNDESIGYHSFSTTPNSKNTSFHSNLVDCEEENNNQDLQTKTDNKNKKPKKSSAKTIFYSTMRRRDLLLRVLDFNFLIFL